jgi:GNAT superfamily N-acetyltransferase
VSEVVKGFDQKLWEGGVADGAFSGERDPDGTWYLLEVDGQKVALAGAVPGPADLTNVSYYVHPDFRGLGYGTKIASRVTDLHEKATFTIFKDNDASIKVALAALRNKFSMTMGHNVVRLTKTADAIPGGKADKKKASDFDAKALAEGAKHEREHTSSDAVAEEIAMDHLTEDPDYYTKLRKIEKKARELLKQAVSVQAGERALQTRLLQSRMKGISSPQALARRTTAAAEVVAKKPLTQLSPEDRKKILKTTRFVRMNMADPKGGEIYKKIKASELGASNQMELPA